MPEFLTINTAHLARLMVFLLCLPAGLLQAQVQSRLSHQVTGLDQPVRLTIEMDGGEDLSPNLT
ncbi:MAG: hypothetical protein JAY64_08075, partial [Candidatus Thiodiazotropha weberae]|nr:hypothetical protein [Candidatus Thiodiazotropha lotti]